MTPLSQLIQEAEKTLMERFPRLFSAMTANPDEIKSLLTSYIKKGYELGGEKKMFSCEFHGANEAENGLCPHCPRVDIKKIIEE